MSRAVVVSGLGTVGAWGAGRSGLLEILAAGEPRLSPLGEPGPLATRRGLRLDPRVAWAAKVDSSCLGPWLPAAAARRMSPPSRFAAAAARMALADAGLSEAPEELLESAAVVLATSYGPSSVTEELLDQILLDGPDQASPALFAESVANAPAAQVARLTGARGANLTVTEREAGALSAVRRAATEVASVRSELALAGAVEEVTPLLQALLDRFGALARGPKAVEDGGPPLARPFDRRRAGLLSGEGSTVVVLEPEDAAAARGARPLARVVGGGSAFDPSASRRGWGRGALDLSRGLDRVLRRCGLAPGEIDLVVSGASGTRAGDRLEAEVLRAVWNGSALPPVVAPKGVTGEMGGGHLAAAMVALEGAELGPSPGFERPDPALGLVPHPGGPLPRPARRVLVSSLAAGGGATWLLFESVVGEAA